MRCPSCSSEVASSSRFCGGCGSRLDASPADPTATVEGGSDAGSRSARAGAESGGSGRVATGVRAGTRTGPADQTNDSSQSGPDRFPPGAVVADRYRVVSLLGRGGMGEVYRADDLKLGRPVALKFLPEGFEADSATVRRFLDEARHALNVTHPNVCRVYDIGEADGHHFLSMEYVDGDNLAALLRQIGRFPKDRAVVIARQVCAGLAAAHQQGILHRDLKPSNVMLDGRGDVKLTDFGLAGVAAEVRERDIRSGTPAYMAPEQLEGREVTVRSDVYALGLVLYEIFTGRRAFEGGTVAELSKRRRDTTPVSPTSIVEGLDPAVERVILRCLEAEPARRPPSVLAVLAALPGGDPIGAALAAGETPSPELLVEAGDAGGLRPALAWAGLAAFLAGTALLIVLAGSTQLVRMSRLDKSPEALADRARDIVRTAGYTDDPADRLYMYGPNEEYLDHLRETGADPRRTLRRLRPGGMNFYYRQSPKPLARMSAGMLGGWFDDPPVTEPGMIQVYLDAGGRLSTFIAVPPVTNDPGRVDAEPDWKPLLAAAGLEALPSRAPDPAWVPPVFADHRAAWEGVYPDAPDVPIHVEGAAHAGRPVWFQIIEPWTKRPGSVPQPPRTLSGTVYILGFVIGLVGASILAVRNIRMGRGDRRTAIRFGLYLGAVRMFWLLGAHHVTGQAELLQFVSHLAFAMQRVGLVWIFYMALEPYARRLWPRMLVSWVRLVDGRFRDPLVGRDLLIGSCAGVVFALARQILVWLPEKFGWPAFPPLMDLWTLETLRGTRQAIGAVAGIHALSVMNFFYPILVFLVFCVLLRRVWIAIALVSAVMLAAFYPGFGSLLAWFLIVPPMLALLWLIFLRVGLLAGIVTFTVMDTFTMVPVAFGPSVWYSGAAVPALVALLFVAGWGFHTALAGRPLFRDEMLAEEPLRAG